MSEKVRVKALDFKPRKSEEWNEYELEDGTVVKVRAVVEEVLMEIDEKGNPVVKNGRKVFHLRVRGEHRILPKGSFLIKKPKQPPPPPPGLTV
jgi:hypothetical protein